MGQRFIPDSYMFQNLIFPTTGQYTGDETPFTYGMGQRIMPRGLDIMILLCPTTSATLTSTISLSFTHNRFYTERIKEGLFHVTVGMQTVPVNVTNVHNGSLTLKSEKPLVYTFDDTFLLMNLNAKKLHIIGHGKAITPS
jgi:hypothetical protein